VRLEALTLLGNFVKGSNVGVTYFDKVAASLKDTAPSVRKAAIKIIFEAFVVAPDSPKASEACQIVLQLASDSQDHNRELVVTFIRDLWFPSQGTFHLPVARATSVINRSPATLMLCYPLSEAVCATLPHEQATASS